MKYKVRVFELPAPTPPARAGAAPPMLSVEMPAAKEVQGFEVEADGEDPARMAALKALSEKDYGVRGISWAAPTSQVKSQHLVAYVFKV